MIKSRLWNNYEMRTRNKLNEIECYTIRLAQPIQSNLIITNVWDRLLKFVVTKSSLRRQSFFIMWRKFFFTVRKILIKNAYKVIFFSFLLIPFSFSKFHWIEWIHFQISSWWPGSSFSTTMMIAMTTIPPLGTWIPIPGLPGAKKHPRPAPAWYQPTHCWYDCSF